MLSEGIDDYRIALRAAEEYGVFHRRSVLEVNYGVLLMDIGEYTEAEAAFSPQGDEGSAKTRSQL